MELRAKNHATQEHGRSYDGQHARTSCAARPQRVMARLATPRIGIVTSYDPNNYAAKVLIQPEGVRDGLAADPHALERERLGHVLPADAGRRGGGPFPGGRQAGRLHRAARISATSSGRCRCLPASSGWSTSRAAPSSSDNDGHRIEIERRDANRRHRT